MKAKDEQPKVTKVSRFHDRNNDNFRRAEQFLLRVTALVLLAIALAKVVIPEAQTLKGYIFSSSQQRLSPENVRMTTPGASTGH